ncbi:hypothetical protein CLOP_g9214 [Closterium sp. NIES-67]|nr:hypothetical protein CLOP_g9214 [Closterium sp. NIES-67]
MTFLFSKALAEIAQRSGSLNQAPKRSESCNSFFRGDESLEPASPFSGSLLQRTKSRREDGPSRVFSWIILAFQSKLILSFLVLPLLACLLVWSLLSRSGAENPRWSVGRQPWPEEIVVESSPSSSPLSQASHGGVAVATARIQTDSFKETDSRLTTSAGELPVSSVDEQGPKEREKAVERGSEAIGGGEEGSRVSGRGRGEATGEVDGSDGRKEEESTGGKEKSRREGKGEGRGRSKEESGAREEEKRDGGDGDRKAEARQGEKAEVESEMKSQGVGEKEEEEREREKRGSEVEMKEKKEAEKRTKKKKGKKRRKHEEDKPEVKLDVPADCDLYHGTWEPDTEPPLYTNNTCAAISRHQNCQGNGRPDSAYERWRWRPGGRGECRGLPRFDAVEFMHVMRGRSVLFVGDSVARNHMESLICLLSQVETPNLRGSKSMVRMVFPRAKLTIARIWSAWLVHESPLPDPSALPSAPATLPRLHLDKTGEKWWREVARYDVVVLCTGHCQGQQGAQRRRLEGSQGVIGGNLEPPLNNTAAFSIGIRTVFRDVAAAAKANPNRLFVFRTYSPDHYEGGQWNTGGSCAGLAEPRGSDYTYENSFGNTIYSEQKEAYNEAMAGLGDGDKWRFGLMDIMPSAGVRVDGHPGPYRGLDSVAELEKRREEEREKGKESKFPPPQDCLHWCLPGPVDSWNVFLFQLIKRHRVMGQTPS